MTAAAKSFLLPEEDPELRRWFISAGIVIAIHAALVSWVMHRREISAAGALAAVVMMDLPRIDIPKSTEAQPEAVETPEAMEIPELPLAQKPVAVLPPPKPKAKPKKKVLPKPVVKQTHERPAPMQRRQVSATLRLGTAGSTAAVDLWRAEIIAHLLSHKPSSAESSGLVTIAFTLARSGHVLGARLAGHSGSSTLDQKALQAVRNANPFPSAPAEVAGGTFGFTVPVHFR